MRLALISDLHGSLPPVPPCDLLVIAGDVCPIEDHDIHFQAAWLHTEFADWLRASPARQAVYVAGNHDFVFARAPGLVDAERVPAAYLQDAGLTWEGLRVWGSPWAVQLTGWPFTAPEDDLADFWRQIDPATRVLVVHGPPYGLGDAAIGRRTGDRLHVGSRTLLDAVERLEHLRLVVCGHIHEAHGVYQHGDVTVVNASHMALGYHPVHPVRVFDLDV